MGMFRITVPVSTKEALLEPEERLLALMKWIALSIDPSSRWSPIFKRYLGIISGRVQDMGGDPTLILPDPNPVDELCCSGQINELLFDHCGHLKAFVMRDSSGRKEEYDVYERGLEEVIMESWREKRRVDVCSRRRRRREICSLTIGDNEQCCCQCHEKGAKKG